MTDEQLVEFDRLALKYSWDLALPEARDRPARLLRRVMDMGLLEDIVAMERAFDGDSLRRALVTAEAGALRPKSWAWWHYRLGLTAIDAAPPPPPVRRFA